MLRRYPPRRRRAMLGETPPPPTEPLFPTAADTEAYLAWLQARVGELDAAVQSFATSMPDRVSAGTLTAGQALSITGSLIGWNGWLLSWNQYAANLSQQSWAGMVKRHVELEQWRHVFASKGVGVPESTKVPQGSITKPGGGVGEAVDKFGTYLGLAAVACVLYVAYKVAS